MRQLASALVARAQLVGREGLTFGGKRDLYENFGYEKNLTPADYKARYERNGMAKCIMETLPRSTWRGGAEVIEIEEPELTEFEKAWVEMEKRLHIWSTFSLADILSGIGEFSAILIGAPGDIGQPLPRTRAENIFFLRAYSQVDVTVGELVEDPTNPRFGFPLTYKFTRLTKKDKVSRHIHYSRVIHVAETPADSVYAPPRLQCIWNYLDDLDKVVGGGSEAFFNRANQGLQLDMDPEVAAVLQNSPEAEKKMKEEVEEYEHRIRKVFRTVGIKANALGSDVANFKQPADAIISLISAATRIPQRILMGSERGQLASTQDKTSWDERVSDRRMEFAEPLVVRQFVDRMIAIGALPTPKEYFVRWPAPEPSLDEMALTAASLAAVNQKNQLTVITVNEIRDKALGLPPIEEVAPDTQRLEEQEREDEHLEAEAQAKAETGVEEEEEDEEVAV